MRCDMQQFVFELRPSPIWISKQFVPLISSLIKTKTGILIFLKVYIMPAY